MKVKAVKKYPLPGYPRKSALDSDPELIDGCIPTRWLKKGLATGTMLVVVAGCDYMEQMSAESPGASHGAGSTDVDAQAALQEGKQEFKVAPLFIHGDGTGATGCVVITPPVFLTEAEAIDVIVAELSRVGFSFSDQPLLVDGVITEERQEIYDSTSEGWPRVAGYTKGQKHLFYFDGFDSDRKIGFKFVSSANYFKLGGPDSNSTVSSYDMVAVAQETRELLGTEKVSAVVFYDPTILRSGCKPPECREESKELLKEQVRDFVAWYARAFTRE